MYMTDPKPGHPYSDEPDATGVMYAKCRNAMPNQAMHVCVCVSLL